MNAESGLSFCDNVDSGFRNLKSLIIQAIFVKVGDFMAKGKREPYKTITFSTTPEMRNKIKELIDETGYSASTVVFKCVEYALKIVKLQAPTRKELKFG